MIGAFGVPLHRHPEDQRDAPGRRRCPGLSMSLPAARDQLLPRRPGEEPVRIGGEIPAPSYGNVHGLPRATCRLCGECDLGCNDGAKNTLDHTYLSAAAHAGADLRTRHEVKASGRADGGGYEVTYVVHTGAGRRTRRRPAAADHPVPARWCWPRARSVDVPAAAQPRRPARPERRARHPLHRQRRPPRPSCMTPPATGRRPPVLEANTGPVITSAIRVADAADGDGSTGRGHYIEDAGYPAFGDLAGGDRPGRLGARRAGKFALVRRAGADRRDVRDDLGGDIAAAGRGRVDERLAAAAGHGPRRPRRRDAA